MDKVKNALLKFGAAVKDKASSLSKKAIITISAVAGVLILSIVILSIIMNQTRYTVLYSGVSSTESSEIVQYARETLGITDIKINGNGDILVDAEQAEDVRVALAIANYPKSGYNYDVWNNGVNAFSTNIEIRERQKQDLETRLMATLRNFNKVSEALVLLNIPQKDDYVLTNNEVPSSAGVTLTLKEDLSAEEVDGMYNLVASAVPGLNRDNITITDQSGAQLFADYSTPTVQEQSEALQMQYKRMAYSKDVKVDLEESIKNILSGAFEDVRVSVGVILNFDKQVSEVLEYSAPNIDEDGFQHGIVSDEEIKQATGGIGTNGGLVGTTTNADISPDYPTLETDEDGQYYTEYSRVINYKINETRKQIEKDGCTFDRLSASVVVKSNNDFTVDEETRWRNTIANAIGADPDYVSIKTAPFVELTNPGIESGNINIGNISSEGMILLAVIIVLGVVLIVLLILALNAPGSRKKRRNGGYAPSAVPAAAGAAASGEEGEGEYMQGDRPARVSEEGEFELTSLNAEVPETREEALKREIQDFSKNNPEIVAQLIRNWMRGDEQ
ncbi:MAG: flagellar M-ring protein FliF [Firmicutes bacterium]|nr:flagellar M-ring protein FliF [[Eubacterium] siraeum]MCM1486954.1 flagellar M-ring protein FliF [Bacillota bacterium]